MNWASGIGLLELDDLGSRPTQLLHKTAARPGVPHVHIIPVVKGKGAAPTGEPRYL